MATKTKNNLNFEQTLEQLEAIVTSLETGNLPLEQALTQFEQGIQLAKQGQAKLNQAEQRIQILLQKNDSASLADYQPE